MDAGGGGVFGAYSWGGGWGGSFEGASVSQLTALLTVFPRFPAVSAGPLSPVKQFELQDPQASRVLISVDVDELKDRAVRCPGNRGRGSVLKGNLTPAAWCHSSILCTAALCMGNVERCLPLILISVPGPSRHGRLRATALHH
jgi:hypothetical protein